MSEPGDAPTRRVNFLRAFVVSFFGTGFSRILGALRDAVLARYLGASELSDAFFIAFTVPNVFRKFVADEGLTGALVPAIARAEEEGGMEAARGLVDATFSLLLVVNVVLCVAGMVFAEPLVLAFAWEYHDKPEQLALTVGLSRWLFPLTAMVSVVSFYEGLLNYKGHFFIPKIAPGLISAFMAAFCIASDTGFADPVWAVTGGTLVGGALHVMVHWPIVARRWGQIALSAKWSDPRVRAIAAELGKVVVIGLLGQANIMVLRQLAVAVGEGAVTWYWNANRLVDLWQGAVAVAVGSALLPNVSRSLAAHDGAQFRGDLHGAVRLTAFLLLPATGALLTFGIPTTSILFRQGNYTWEDTVQTSQTLQMLVPFMLALAGINLVKKVFFAVSDRNTLFWVGALGVALTAGIGWVLVERFQVMGLAAALSISTVLQLVAYLAVLPRKVPHDLGWSAVATPLLKMSLATLPLVVVLAVFAQAGDWPLGPTLWNLGVVLLGCVAGATAYGIAAWLLGIEEFTRVSSRITARLRRS